MPDDKVSRLDYFAGCALSGILASHDGDREYPPPAEVAEWAYGFAEAMEAERAERSQRPSGDQP